MKIGRLFEILYILLDKKTVTAKDLSTRFEVSTRTIYRDIDILCQSGIPIYTSKGKSGGISLVDNFILNKSLISDKEKNEIIMGLQSIRAVDYHDVSETLTKMNSFLGKSNSKWIDIDFAPWGSHENEREKFTIIRDAIISNRTVMIDYYNAYNQFSKREIEPVRLVFKQRSWYLYAYCLLKSSLRMFKVTRIHGIELTNNSFVMRPDIFNEDGSLHGEYDDGGKKNVHLRLLFSKDVKFRLYDEFSSECITENEDGTLLLDLNFPEDEWVYSFILSFGHNVTVLSPKYLKEIIRDRLMKTLGNYGGN